MSKELLKKYIMEAIRVDITHITGSVETPLKSLNTRDMSRDDIEELSWLVDKYGRAPIKFGRRKDEETGKERKWFQKISEPVVDEVLNVLDLPEKETKLLKTVLANWGQEGFDVIRLIAQAKSSGLPPFPFFKWKKFPSGKAVHPFPTDPSPRIVSILNSRVTPGTAGPGEFLLAILTGGLPTREGDLLIKGKVWEVKQPEAGNVVRLGDKQSKIFERGLINNVGYAAFSNAEPGLKSYYKNKGFDPDFVQGVENAFAECISSVEGFILVKNDKFEVYNRNDAIFHSFSSQGRVFARFEKSSVKSSVKSSDA